MAELGRRARLKIWWAQARGGSIPPPGTISGAALASGPLRGPVGTSRLLADFDFDQKKRGAAGRPLVVLPLAQRAVIETTRRDAGAWLRAWR